MAPIAVSISPPYSTQQQEEEEQQQVEGEVEKAARVRSPVTFKDRVRYCRVFFLERRLDTFEKEQAYCVRSYRYSFIHFLAFSLFGIIGELEDNPP